MTKQVENYHILSSPITDEVFIGTIKKKESERLGEGNVISENKVNRTSEFNTALINIYKNTQWKLTNKKDNFNCCIIDNETLEKNKNKTLKEFFGVKND